MSARAKEFLDEWVQGIAATGDRPESEEEMAKFVDTCITDASADGISEHELVSAADGNLAEYILAGLGQV